MFKQFRNKMFGIFLFVICLLIVGSLSFVYYQSYSDMKDSIVIRLDGGDSKGGGIGKEQQSEPTPPDVGAESIDDSQQFIRDGIVITSTDDIQTAMDNYFAQSVEVDENEKLITVNNDIYAYNQISSGYRVVQITYDIEYLHSLRNNLIILALFSICAFAIIGFILISRLIEPLKQAYEVQEQFVSDASHELKTPLAVIKSCLNLIANEDDDKDNLIEYCQGETDRLIRLTSNLLQLSENTNDQYPQIDISKNLNIAISGIEVEMYEQGMNFEGQISPDISGRIAGDDLTQLLHIFLDNARKYNDHRRKIILSCSQEGKYLRLDVKNSTEPLSPMEINRIFERFYRIDKVRQEKGFGLGLALAKHIAEKYHGDIKANYESGYFHAIVRLEK